MSSVTPGRPQAKEKSPRMGMPHGHRGGRVHGPSAGVWILLPSVYARGEAQRAFIPFSAVMLPHHKLLPLQNHSNSDVVSIDCNVKLAPNEDMNLHLHGNLWMKSLKAVSPPKADARLLRRNSPKEPSHHDNMGGFSVL